MVKEYFLVNDTTKHDLIGSYSTTCYETLGCIQSKLERLKAFFAYN